MGFRDGLTIFGAVCLVALVGGYVYGFCSAAWQDFRQHRSNRIN